MTSRPDFEQDPVMDLKALRVPLEEVAEAMDTSPASAMVC